MIYLILGPSCSGKTQIVTNSFIEEPISCYRDLIPITKTSKAYLIGDFTKSGKVRGTDRISRSQLKQIAPQIIKCFENSSLDVVAEGVNVCWRFVLDPLIPYNKDVTLIYLKCNLETSLKRNLSLNPSCNKSWFKSVYTRSENTFFEYSSVFDSYLVNTENADFSTISLSNCELVKFSKPKTFELF